MSMQLRGFIQTMIDANRLGKEFTPTCLKELARDAKQAGSDLAFGLSSINLASIVASTSGKRWIEKVPESQGHYRLVANSSTEATAQRGKAVRTSKLPSPVPEQLSSWSVNTGMVPGFIDWIASCEMERAFVFGYDADSTTSHKRFALRAESIEGAADAYHWPSRRDIPNELIGHIRGIPDRSGNLTNTIKLLTMLREELRQSRDDNDLLRHWKACWAILHWGGVARTSNLEFYALKYMAGNLIDYHRAAHGPNGWFDPAATTEMKLLENVLGMSAGITKVHSLIADELLIYDSRVACTFAWFVDRYCDQLTLTKVPDELNFSLPEPDKGKKSKRIQVPELVRQDLSSRITTEYKRAPGKERWSRDMLRTSLILSAVLRKLGKTSKGIDDSVVDPNEFLKYQLGLFMIGYDLAKHRVNRSR